MIVDDQGVFHNLLMPVNSSHQTRYGLIKLKIFKLNQTKNSK